ncbi:MAG: nucleotidyltransferase family protein [Anaerolineae bacterium]|nr:nucleotidyltransferase family protein [Anaerolineae bacterium]
MIHAQDAIRIYRHLLDHGIPVWLIGGWGIDALLGEQTRPHKDLDVLVLVDDVAPLCELLAHDGYGLKELWSENRRTLDALGVEVETAFVLSDSEGREIDVHALRFDDGGNGIPAWEAAGFLFRTGDLGGEGSIGGMTVRCVTPEMQMVCHTGYDLPSAHQQDVKRLRERFGVEVPDSTTRPLGP